jgi:hypothetical protein
MAQSGKDCISRRRELVVSLVDDASTEKSVPATGNDESAGVGTFFHGSVGAR